MANGKPLTSRKLRVLRAARRKAARWLRRPEVVSVGIGLRRCAGARRDEACVVVTVDYKLAPSELAQRRRRCLPRWLDVEVDGKRARVRVDVQQSGGQRRATLQGLVGDNVRKGAKVIGSVSAVVEAEGERAVLISGHVARERGRTLRVGGLKGVTREPLRDAWLDHCVVDVPELPPDAASLVDGVTLAGVRAPEQVALGEALFFHRAETGKRLQVALSGLAVSAWVELAPGDDVLMRDLITTEAATVAGDSGALLYDASFRAVATLVGVLGDASHYVPIKRALSALGVSLAVKEPS